ncbi:MAG: hypothetical protein ABJB66_07885 [Gemmatimonadaceae bacterium]
MQPTGSGFSIPTKLLATGVACAVAVVVCGTAATVVAASNATRKQPPTAGAARPDFDRFALESFRDAGSIRALLDSLVAPLDIRGAANPNDIATIASATSQGSRASQVWDIALREVLPTMSPTPFASVGVLDTSWENLSVERTVRAERDSATPWLPVFRRWARSQPMQPLWGYRKGLPGVRDIHDLPLRNFRPILTLYSANESAAYLQLRDGKSGMAVEHARENISASRHFLEQPFLFDALLGRILVKRSASLLAVAAARAGDSATARQARRLLTAAKHNDDMQPLRQWLRQQEGISNSTAAEEIAANVALAPSIRIEAIQSIVVGACGSTPEIVFGFNGARRVALNKTANALHDLNRADEIANGYVRLFDQLAEDPVSYVDRYVKPVQDGAFDWIVPPGVRARIDFCAMQGNQGILR